MGLFRAGFEVVGVDVNPQPDYPFEFRQMSALDVDLSEFDFVWASPPCFLFTGIIPEEQRRLHGHKWDHPNLIPPIREMALAAGKPYIIENVAGAASELVDPVKLCGTMFDLRVFRHRLFESNAPIIASRYCDHRNCGLGIHSPKPRKGDIQSLPKEWRIEKNPEKDQYTYVSPDGQSFRSIKSACHVARNSNPPPDFKQFFPVYGMPGQRGSMKQWSEAMGIDWMTKPKSLALAIPPAYSEFLGRQVLDMMGYTVDYKPVSYASHPSDLF